MLMDKLTHSEKEYVIKHLFPCLTEAIKLVSTIIIIIHQFAHLQCGYSLWMRHRDQGIWTSLYKDQSISAILSHPLILTRSRQVKRWKERRRKWERIWLKKKSRRELRMGETLFENRKDRNVEWWITKWRETSKATMDISLN
jgi:hypothetical protein